MNKTPLISTVMRFHKGGNLEYLKEALTSLYSQSHTNIEIVLCMQNIESEDLKSVENVVDRLQSESQAKSKRVVKYLHSESEGNADIRSKLLLMGIESASGEYLGFLDYDDILYPHAYEVFTGFFPKDKEIAFIAGSVDRVIMVNVDG
ncbi:MAG: glycosyltransferase, partial [Bdellovibrionales bacterium]